MRKKGDVRGGSRRNAGRRRKGRWWMRKTTGRSGGEKGDI